MSYAIGRNVVLGSRDFATFKISNPSKFSLYALPGLKYREPMLIRNQPTIEMVERIIQAVTAHYMLEREMVFSRIRKREYVVARQLMHYFLKKYTTMSLSEIGETIFSGKPLDHTTIIHSIATIKDLMDSDPEFNEEVLTIQQSI